MSRGMFFRDRRVEIMGHDALQLKLAREMTFVISLGCKEQVTCAELRPPRSRAVEP